MTRWRDPARTTFRAASVRNCRLFLIGQLASQLGTWVCMTAQTLLVLELTDDGVALGVVVASQFVPVLVLGPWAGVLCDRVDRRRVMYVTQAVLGAQAVALGVLVATGTASVLLVCVIAAGAGIAKAFDDPPRRTMVVTLVDQQLVANAVGLNSAMANIARLCGPAVGALLIAVVGSTWCFIVNSFAFVVAIAAIASMRDAEMQPLERVGVARGQIREALLYVRANDELRHTVWLLVVVSSLAFSWQTALPLVSERSLDGGSGTFALLSATMGVGSLAGSLIVARRHAVDSGYLAWSSVGFGFAALLVGLSPNTFVAAATTLLWGIAAFVFVAGAQVVMQLTSTAALGGRVMALFGMLACGGTATSCLVCGVVTDHAGIGWGLVVTATAATIAGVATLAASKADRRTAVQPAMAGLR